MSPLFWKCIIYTPVIFVTIAIAWYLIVEDQKLKHAVDKAAKFKECVKGGAIWGIGIGIAVFLYRSF